MRLSGLEEIDPQCGILPIGFHRLSARLLHGTRLARHTERRMIAPSLLFSSTINSCTVRLTGANSADWSPFWPQMARSRFTKSAKRRPATECRSGITCRSIARLSRREISMPRTAAPAACASRRAHHHEWPRGGLRRRLAVLPNAWINSAAFAAAPQDWSGTSGSRQRVDPCSIVVRPLANQALLLRKGRQDERARARRFR
jgi:hypothetical protein